MIFKKFKIGGWKQFSNVDIEFHPKITILTGANSSGKTTILNLLAKHFGWDVGELSVPKKNKETGFFGFIIKLFKTENTEEENIDQTIIGSIGYSNDKLTKLTVPVNLNSAKYQIHMPEKEVLEGVYIPSHRPIFGYRNIEHISTDKDDTHAIASRSRDLHRQKYIDGSGEPSNLAIKDTLLSWSLFGFGNEKFEADDKQGENDFDPAQHDEACPNCLQKYLNSIHSSIIQRMEN